MTNDEIERPCAECGMPCKPKEYHPYAACLMFKACRSCSAVRANLESVQSAAVEADRKRAQAAGIRAWETEDGRVISAAQKLQAERDGGAGASSVKPYSIPLVAAGAQAAEPVGYLDDDYAASLDRNGSAVLWREPGMPRGRGVEVYPAPARPAVTVEAVKRDNMPVCARHDFTFKATALARSSELRREGTADKVIHMIDADRRIETLINQMNEVVDRFRNQGVTAAAAIGSLDIVKAELLHELIGGGHGD